MHIRAAHSPVPVDHDGQVSMDSEVKEVLLSTDIGRSSRNQMRRRPTDGQVVLELFPISNSTPITFGA